LSNRVRPVTAMEPDPRRQRAILAVCCISLLLVSMDATIVNVALPSVQRDLHASVSGLQWTVDAYTLVLASLLILSGSAADRFGRRRVFRSGLCLFTLGSLLCSVAPSLDCLIAFRMIQAVGGSMLNPVALSIIANTFTVPRERAWAIGVWGGVAGVSFAVGPVLGGVLVSSVGWRSIFWINVPVGVAAMILAGRIIPESRAPRPRRPDWGAQFLILTFLASLTYAIIAAPADGWSSGTVVALVAVSLLAATALLVLESRRREPLIDLRFFRSAPFTGATFTAVAAFFALGGFLFLNTLYLQNVRGYSAAHAGLLTVPMAAAMGLAAPLSGRLVANRGPRLPLMLAAPALALGASLLIGLNLHTPLLRLLVGYILFGAGFGLVNAPISNAAVSGMPRAQAGVAGAVASTSRQIGATLGVAVTGSIAAVASGSTVDPTSALAWILIAACGLSVLVPAIVSTGPWATGTAERTRALFASDWP